MSEHIASVSDETFDSEVLKSSLPVLVDFWAEWCGPCRMIAPIVDEVAAEYVGKLSVVKINVDDSTETAATYGVRGIPTLALFKEGKLVDTKVGAVTKTQLVEFLDKNL